MATPNAGTEMLSTEEAVKNAAKAATDQYKSQITPAIQRQINDLIVTASFRATAINSPMSKAEFQREIDKILNKQQAQKPQAPAQQQEIVQPQARYDYSSLTDPNMRRQAEAYHDRVIKQLTTMGVPEQYREQLAGGIVLDALTKAGALPKSWNVGRNTSVDLDTAFGARNRGEGEAQYNSMVETVSNAYISSHSPRQTAIAIAPKVEKAEQPKAETVKTYRYEVSFTDVGPNPVTTKFIITTSKPIEQMPGATDDERLRNFLANSSNYNYIEKVGDQKGNIPPAIRSYGYANEIAGLIPAPNDPIGVFPVVTKLS